ncbi:sorting nexin-5 [Hydra vulgaris]|uniref:sorting nexin-5 n=1 Tax=Hydra vulgaris TaxID=6087 RepID=UPI000640C938|nr:sorting nexin-5 [Hydra vulgaris]
MLYKITVSDATKDGDIVKFTVQSKLMNDEESLENDTGKIVFRQYEDFVYLLHLLTTKNNVAGVVVPPLPNKPVIIPETVESKLNLKTTVLADGYSHDCKRLEKFIQDIANHKVFKDDENLKKFLTDDEAVARVAIKRGVMNSLANLVDTARFQAHKDIDEDFQKKRDNVNALLLHVKQCNYMKDKMISSEKALGVHISNLAMVLRNSATYDIQGSKIVVRFIGQFADVLDELVLKGQKTRLITEETAGFSLELYSRYLSSCQSALFQRTCKLVELENATKALEKAKPKNREQLLSAKEEASIAFDRISEVTKAEVELFNENRVKHFKESLSLLAQKHQENHRETCELLLSAINELKNL